MFIVYVFGKIITFTKRYVNEMLGKEHLYCMSERSGNGESVSLYLSYLQSGRSDSIHE